MTTTSLRANLLTHLRFCARNRLLLVFAVAFVLFSGLSMLPMLIMSSMNVEFDMVHQIASMVTGFVSALLYLIALLLIWYHKRQKAVKLVFTKPCTPGQWVLSLYLTGLVLFVVANALILVLAATVMLARGIPWQWGIPVAMLYNLIHFAYVYFFLLTLSALMHPIPAVLVFYALQDQTYYYFAMWTQAGADAVQGTLRVFCLEFLHSLSLGLYYVLPGGLFTREMQTLLISYRLSAANWSHLLGEAGYTVLFCFLMYRLTVYALHRQRHV